MRKIDRRTLLRQGAGLSMGALAGELLGSRAAWAGSRRGAAGGLWSVDFGPVRVSRGRWPASEVPAPGV
ncbi:MAG: hypothetical protein ACRD5Z_13010, partial [Bryobacteraceae bacterium]